jgi:hypothetical protein
MPNVKIYPAADLLCDFNYPTFFRGLPGGLQNFNNDEIVF